MLRSKLSRQPLYHGLRPVTVPGPGKGDDVKVVIVVKVLSKTCVDPLHCLCGLDRVR